MPSWCMPACSAWSAALLDASMRNGGMPAAEPIGSPQRYSTLASYSGGTRSRSSSDGAIGVKLSCGREACAVLQPDSAPSAVPARAALSRARLETSTSSNDGLALGLQLPGTCRLRLMVVSPRLFAQHYRPCKNRTFPQL